MCIADFAINGPTVCSTPYLPYSGKFPVPLFSFPGPDINKLKTVYLRLGKTGVDGGATINFKVNDVLRSIFGRISYAGTVLRGCQERHVSCEKSGPCAPPTAPSKMIMTQAYC